MSPVRKLAEMLELPGEVVLNLPVMQVHGNEDVVLSNYKGLVEFSEEQVRISTRTGIIRLEGVRLTLRRIAAESVSISGRITKIEFLT